MDSRLALLTQWVDEQLSSLGMRGEYEGPIELTVVSGDASFRRYFRLPSPGKDIPSLIAVDAPPPQEDCRPFVAVAKGLLAAGAMVPEVKAVEYEQGLMLLSDLGDSLLLDGLDVDNVETRYGLAFASLPNVMGCQADVPLYGEAKLRQEMSLFADWFLQRYLEVSIPSDVLDGVFDLFVTSALEQPQVFVHRDYHSRNLMLTPGLSSDEPLLGIIDFQDAVQGPVTYDIVSLLRDCYVAWPTDRVNQWVEQIHQQLRDCQLIEGDVSLAQFMQWFDWMGAQRHLKAIGIFARLDCRDGKPGYLLDIPRTLRYLLDVCDKYAADHDVFAKFAIAIRQQVLPALFKRNPDAESWFEPMPRFDYS